MAAGEDYFVRIPIEIYGRGNLENVLLSIRGMTDATHALSSEQRAFANLVRDEVNALQSLDKALAAIITGANGASESHRMMAMGLRALMQDLHDAEAASDRTAQAFGRIGGRILGAEVLGRGMGIPGGGFIGSQLMYSLGGNLSPAMLAGFGAGALGVVGAYAGYQVTNQQAQYAQQQSNLAAQYGTSPQDMQMLGNVAKITDTSVVGLLGTLRSLSKEMQVGGEESRKIQQALSDLGLSTGLAFEHPMDQLQQVVAALRKVGDESERERLAVGLLGESGRQLLPLVDSFQSITEVVRQSGAIIDQEGIQKLVQFRQASKELELAWDSLKSKMAEGIVAAINVVLNGNPSSVAGGTAISGGLYGAVAGGAAGSMVTPVLGTAIGAILGFIAGDLGGASYASHYGVPPSPTMPGGNIPSGVASIMAGRLDRLDRLRPEGSTHIENLQRDLKQITTKLEAAREQSLYGGGHIGYTTAGDPAEMAALYHRQQEKLAMAKQLEDDIAAGKPFGGTAEEASAYTKSLRDQAGAYGQQIAAGQRMVPYLIPGKGGNIDDVRNLEQQRVAKERQIKDAQEYERQLSEFRRLQPLGELTPEQAAAEGRTLGHRFSLLQNLPAYQSRMSSILGMESGLISAEFGDLTGREFTRMLSGAERDERQKESAADKFWREVLHGDVASQRAGMDVARGTATEQARFSRTARAEAMGFSRYGMTPSQLAQRELAASLTGTYSELGGRSAGLRGEIGVLQSASRQYGLVPTEEGRNHKMEADAAIEQKQLELKASESDALVKAIEAVNRFNESIDKAAESMRSEFAGGFAGVLMGAQRGAYHGRGGQGALQSLRGWFENIESTMLKNVGEKVYDSGVGADIRKGAASLHLPDWLTKGTIFGHLDDPIGKNTKALDKNATSTDDLRKAIERLLAAIAHGGGTGTSPSGAGGSGAGADASSSSGDIAQQASSIAAAAGSLAQTSTGTAAQDLKAVQSAFGKLAVVGSGFAAGMKLAGSNSYGILFGGQGATGTVKAGAAIGDLGLALGAAEGGMTMAKGGARNVAGGLSGVLGAAAMFDPDPVSKMALGIAAAASGLVASFLPDPHSVRAQEMAKTMFTSTYLAPPAIHMSAGENAGYADFDMYGGLRTSNLSPYPVNSMPYLDVPRRTIIPGHSTQQFGGGSTLPPSALNPQLPPIHLHIQALDSRSIMDRAGDIVDAFHRGISESHHPVINTVGQQLGIR